MDSSLLTQQRFLSLDSLRGVAILLMVLSGSIAFGGVLPAWMYHAQVPSPTHTFNPNIAGITWVDLVFPFFLFSMGAALPIALSKKVFQKGIFLSILEIFKRYTFLIFFAIFTYHARAWVMASQADITQNLLSVACFFLLFVMLAKTPFESQRFSIVRQGLGFLIAIAFLTISRFSYGKLDLFKSDIIIIVLANMALFGAVIWLFTRRKPWLRVAILPLIMGVFLSGKIENSWTNTLFNWSPIPWAYTFYYLKYLFIIIPGTFVGDWLLKIKKDELVLTTNKKTFFIGVLCILLVVLNTIFLFDRQITTNLIITAYITIVILFLVKKASLANVYQNFIYLGISLLIIGLFFEPYEGGIKKDPSTYSYYFVCSGMAILVLFSFMLFEAAGYFKIAFKTLAQVGQNPMIAYTAGNLLLLPLLRVTNLETQLNLLNSNPIGGLFRGLIFTTVVAAVACFFTKQRIFLKT